MDKKSLDTLKALMDELYEEMEMGEEDFSERLGRSKPEVKMVSLKAGPMMEEDMPEEEMEEEMEDGMEMMGGMDDESKLKKRIMAMRG